MAAADEIDCASRSRYFSSGGCQASIQCAEEMNSSSDLDGSTSRTRIGKIGLPLLTARSTSRLTKLDSFAFSERTNTNTALDSIPSTISAEYSRPGVTSRGAIQHETPLLSR
jgi:hypothetical protein